MEFEAYLDALASAQPTPGGGSAATLAGALGAALCAMVGRITAAAPKHAAVHAAAAAVADDADDVRAAFLALRPDDEAAFRTVIVAQALPRATDDERTRRDAHVQAALVQAATVPLEVAALAAETFALIRRTAALHNVHLASDVACALHFARATLEAAGENVRVNHHYLRDAATVAEQAELLETAQARAFAHERAAAEMLAAG